MFKLVPSLPLAIFVALLNVTSHRTDVLSHTTDLPAQQTPLSAAEYSEPRCQWASEFRELGVGSAILDYRYKVRDYKAKDFVLVRIFFTSDIARQVEIKDSKRVATLKNRLLPELEKIVLVDGKGPWLKIMEETHAKNAHGTFQYIFTQGQCPPLEQPPPSDLTLDR